MDEAPVPDGDADVREPSSGGIAEEDQVPSLYLVSGNLPAKSNLRPDSPRKVYSERAEDEAHERRAIESGTRVLASEPVRSADERECQLGDALPEGAVRNSRNGVERPGRSRGRQEDRAGQEPKSDER